MKFEHIKSVMIVDDDPVFVAHLTGILKNEGFHVKSASTCLDALNVVSNDVPDLFLIDLAMPTITGDRLCKVLNSQPKLAGSYRVILSTIADEAVIDLESVEAHACIAKEPLKIMPANLFKVLRQLDQTSGRPVHDEELDFQSQKKNLKEKLQHAQKMEAIGTLAGGIAHDFNNILQAILGYSQLSLFEHEIPPKVIRNLEEIQTSAHTATSLIRRLLVFSRKVDSQHRPVDLNKQVNHVSHMLERTIPRMIRIEHQLDKGLRLINADGSLMEQILMNLGVNARDAMPDGGRILFSTRNVDLDDSFCAEHTGAKPGPNVQLTVADTGLGMTDEVRKHIYDPFFTTKHSGQGTGLGLAMVYGIVKDHSGFITCESKPGEGSVFTIYFPVIDPNHEDNAVQPLENEAPIGGTETILLVDDEKGICDLGRQILEKYGYTVVTALSGEEALSIYRHASVPIDLAIIDLSMPGMGGLKCIKYLRELHPDCRVIVSSGYAAKDKIKSALETVAQEFVTKPYSIRDLLPKIRSVIDHP